MKPRHVAVLATSHLYALGAVRAQISRKTTRIWYWRVWLVHDKRVHDGGQTVADGTTSTLVLAKHRAFKVMAEQYEP